MKYVVKIEEKLARSYVVEAESEDEAWDIINDGIASENIVLDYEDYIDREIEVSKLSQKEIEDGWWDDHPTYP